MTFVSLRIMDYIISVILIQILLCLLSITAFNPFRNVNLNKAKPSGLIWSETFECPESMFINGLNPVFLSDDIGKPNWQLVGRRVETFPLGIHGLNASCASFNQDSEVQRYVPYIARTNDQDSAPRYRLSQKESSVCAPSEDGKPFGLAVGIEKRISSNGTLLELAFYCNYEQRLSRQIDLTPNIGVSGGRWTKPYFCPWGQYLCAYRAQYRSDSFEIMDFRVECCPALEKNFGWTNYRGETFGTVLESLRVDSEEEKKLSKVGYTRSNYHLHYMTELDDPYYFQWSFCPVTTYVVGLQTHPSLRQFRLICSDISIPLPRPNYYISPRRQGDIWEEEDVSDQLICQGLATGFQILYDEMRAEIQGIRFLCSYSKGDEVPYVKAILPPATNSNNSKYSWGIPQMCPRHQTLCGLKAKLIQGKQGELEGTEHMKFKCCNVPSVAEVCTPYDEYELIAECDSRQALADTTCTYTQTEGLTSTISRSNTQNLGWDMRRSLSKEWSLTQTDTQRRTDETSKTNTHSTSLGTSDTKSVSETLSQSQTNSETDSHSILQGTTSHETNSRTQSKQRSRTLSIGTDRSRVFTSSTRTEQSFGNMVGESSTHGNEVGTNYLNTQSFGTTVSDSNSDTFGLSLGTLKGTTTGTSDSSSSGSSNTNSGSWSDTHGQSQSHGTSSSSTDSSSKSIGAEVGGGFGPWSAAVKTNFEKSSSKTKGTSSENSQHSSSTSGGKNSESRNNQVGHESSKSNQAQSNSELSASSSRHKGSEVSNQKSSALGGHATQSNSNTQHREQSQLFTQGSENGVSDGITHRQNEENSEQEGQSWTHESGLSHTNQETREQSKTTSNTAGKENTLSQSSTSTAEKTEGASNTQGTSSTKETSNSRNKGGSATDDKTLRTGYDWSQSSESTWKQEKSHQVLMNIPPGTRTRLYQVVGHCDQFQVRANNFRRVDFKA